MKKKKMTNKSSINILSVYLSIFSPVTKNGLVNFFQRKKQSITKKKKKKTIS